MQNNSQAEKKKVLFDNEEIPGLTNVAEFMLEKGVIEVPEFAKTRVIQNGVEKVSIVELTYQIKRESGTLQFFKDFYFNQEVKDVTIIRTDAHGSEFARDLLPGCESIKYTVTEYDAANPTYAQIKVTLVPWDLIPVEAI
jgi:hypothetical protein